MALQWDFEKNFPETPDTATSQSKKSCWWLCPKGHSFSAVIRARVNKKSGCPVCANRQILPGFNDLAHLEPELSAEWHPSKNGDLLPTQISKGSEKKVWWKCSKGHEWEISPNHRTTQRTNCPYCSNKKILTGYNDLKTTHPEIVKEWDSSDNLGVDPDSIGAGSHHKAAWVCEKGHKWRTAIVRRTRENTGCPICSNNLVVAGLNDIATTDPKLLSEWDWESNDTIDPSLVVSGSQIRVWWKCELGHRWKTSPSKRSSGQNCPICIGKKVLSGFNDLVTTNPELAKEWDYTRNLSLTPGDVTAMSNKSIWWCCDSGHSWKTVISNRSLGRGCPTCGNKKVLEGFNDLLTTHPLIADSWDQEANGDLHPNMVVGGSGQKVWWKCEQGHSWQATVSSRTSGRGCPGCAIFGYDPNSPGVLYFIENSSLRAKKIGITNANNRGDRIRDWKKSGWNLVSSFEHPHGLIIANLETKLLFWIRKEIGLPQFLGDSEMKRLGGATETFSADGLSNEDVLMKIRLEAEVSGVKEVITRNH